MDTATTKHRNDDNSKPSSLPSKCCKKSMHLSEVFASPMPSEVCSILGPNAVRTSLHVACERHSVFLTLDDDDIDIDDDDDDDSNVHEENKEGKGVPACNDFQIRRYRLPLTGEDRDVSYRCVGHTSVLHVDCNDGALKEMFVYALIRRSVDASSFSPMQPAGRLIVCDKYNRSIIQDIKFHHHRPIALCATSSLSSSGSGIFKDNRVASNDRSMSILFVSCIYCGNGGEKDGSSNLNSSPSPDDRDEHRNTVKCFVLFGESKPDASNEFAQVLFTQKTTYAEDEYSFSQPYLSTSRDKSSTIFDHLVDPVYSLEIIENGNHYFLGLSTQKGDIVTCRLRIIYNEQPTPPLIQIVKVVSFLVDGPSSSLSLRKRLDFEDSERNAIDLFAGNMYLGFISLFEDVDGDTEPKMRNVLKMYQNQHMSSPSGLEESVLALINFTIIPTRSNVFDQCDYVLAGSRSGDIIMYVKISSDNKYEPVWRRKLLGPVHALSQRNGNVVVTTNHFIHVFRDEPSRLADRAKQKLEAIIRSKTKE